ncbi:MAG: hypothetical protein NTX50_04295 [Candidatus Sumerlaeota bacterium]|nr:hypothetical protein [Candidatus Sumerlaeota bacterium]
MRQPASFSNRITSSQFGGRNKEKSNEKQQSAKINELKNIATAIERLNLEKAVQEVARASCPC